MNKKGKRSIADRVDIVLTALSIIFIILPIVLGFLRFRLRTESAITVTAECQVVDKFVKSPNSSSTLYFITLLFTESGAEFEKDVQITEESALSGVTVGDTLPCTVMYDENGIVQIQISDSTAIQQIDEREELWTGVFIFFGIVGVITGVIGFFLLLKRLDKKAYEQSVAKNTRR